MGKLAPNFQTDRAQAVKDFDALQAQNASRINSVLTPQQQTAWQQMIGSPYSFSPDTYLPSNANAPGTPK